MPHYLDTQQVPHYQQAPQAFQEEEPAEALSQAEILRLQRLKQGRSSVQERMDSGELAPEESGQLMQMINQGMAPLMDRQNKAMKQQKNMLRQSMFETAGTQEALAQQNAEFRAQGIESRIAVVKDPITGRTAHLYENSPNSWAQVEWPEPERDENAPNWQPLGGGSEEAAGGAGIAGMASALGAQALAGQVSNGFDRGESSPVRASGDEAALPLAGQQAVPQEAAEPPPNQNPMAEESEQEWAQRMMNEFGPDPQTAPITGVQDVTDAYRRRTEGAPRTQQAPQMSRFHQLLPESWMRTPEGISREANRRLDDFMARSPVRSMTQAESAERARAEAELVHLRSDAAHNPTRRNMARLAMGMELVRGYHQEDSQRMAEFGRAHRQIYDSVRREMHDASILARTQLRDEAISGRQGQRLEVNFTRFTEQQERSLIRDVEAGMRRQVTRPRNDEDARGWTRPAWANEGSAEWLAERRKRLNAEIVDRGFGRYVPIQQGQQTQPGQPGQQGPGAPRQQPGPQPGPAAAPQGQQPGDLRNVPRERWTPVQTQTFGTLQAASQDQQVPEPLRNAADAMSRDFARYGSVEAMPENVRANFLHVRQRLQDHLQQRGGWRASGWWRTIHNAAQQTQDWILPVPEAWGRRGRARR